MPLVNEYRTIWLKGLDAPLIELPYWDANEVEASVPVSVSRPPDHLFLEVVESIQSNLFTLDMAERADGEWLIVECGDAQVTGLPEHADVEDFYYQLSLYLPDIARKYGLKVDRTMSP